MLQGKKFRLMADGDHVFDFRTLVAAKAEAIAGSKANKNVRYVLLLPAKGVKEAHALTFLNGEKIYDSRELKESES